MKYYIDRIELNNWELSNMLIYKQEFVYNESNKSYIFIARDENDNAIGLLSPQFKRLYGKMYKLGDEIMLKKLYQTQNGRLELLPINYSGFRYFESNYLFVKIKKHAVYI